MGPNQYGVDLGSTYDVLSLEKSLILRETTNLIKPYPQLGLFINIHRLKFICRAMIGPSLWQQTVFSTFPEEVPVHANTIRPPTELRL